MNYKKPLLVAGAVTSIGAASVLGLATASAATNNSGNDTLVDKLATTFNLNKDDVQKVFDEERKANEAERQAKVEERLDQAVKDGKITEEQKAKILAKIEEMKADHPDPAELENKTPAEMKALMEQKRKDLEAWAEQNDIPMEYLKFRHHIKGPGPKGEGEMHIRFKAGGDEGPSFDVQAD